MAKRMDKTAFMKRFGVKEEPDQDALKPQKSDGFGAGAYGKGSYGKSRKTLNKMP